MVNYNKSIDTYQKIFELLIAMSKSTLSFARLYRYTFWERIINYTLDATAETFLAKEAFKYEQKITHINNALKNISLLCVLWKVCGEIPNLSTNIYLEQIENITSISKQLRARLDYCEKNLEIKN